MTNTVVNKAKETANGAGLRDLRSDLNNLKDDAVATIHDAAALAKNLKNESGTLARDGVKHLADVGRSEFERLEERVRDRPGQSVALAFCAGLVFSYMMRGRR